jgi:3-hydroxybutyryl-CoA dehydrogenase
VNDERADVRPAQDAASPYAEAPFSIHAVAVIGAGRAGREFALACAAAGFDVVLEDVMPANLRRAQEEYADLATSVSGAQSSTGRLAIALTVEDAVRGADIAVDFLPDELESKLEIFSMVDRMAPPRTAMLTPSDTLSITDLASCTYRGDRCFAVQGGLVAGAAMRLVYPAGVEQGVLHAVGVFLRTLGGEAQAEEDTESPMLVKNLR